MIFKTRSKGVRDGPQRGTFAGLGVFSVQALGQGLRFCRHRRAAFTAPGRQQLLLKGLAQLLNQ